MFYFVRFVVCWLLWLALADKKRWRELFPIGFFAGFAGSLADNLMFERILWQFPGVSMLRSTVLDDLGVNLVFTYLFIQWLPKRRTWVRMFLYWLVWTLVALAIEWIHITSGHLTYRNGWNLGWSYLSDWMLLTLFYAYYRVFRFHQLSHHCVQE